VGGEHLDPVEEPPARPECGGPIDPAEVRRMYEANMSIRAIAAKIGRSYSGVHKALTKSQATMRPPSRPAVPAERPECGTKKGHQWHLDHGEEPDEACRRANADYSRDFDDRTGYSKARSAAYRRLADTFPALFAALLEEERAKARDERPGEAARAWGGRALQRAYRRLAMLPAVAEVFEVILAEERRKAAAGVNRSLP
jgi:hypothetical protein